MSQLPTNAQVTSPGSEFNALDFAIWQKLAKVNTIMPVKIVAVHGGGISADCFADVQPLVNQIDGNGAAVPHGVVYNLPVFRLQGGNSAIVLDPVVGDIGAAGFCHRDISAVKATKAQANPGSRRKFSLSDGIYFGGILNSNPTQYVLMSSAGIKIVSPTAIEMDAPTITLNGSSPVTITPDAIIAGHQIGPHRHGGVQSGGSDTGTMA